MKEFTESSRKKKKFSISSLPCLSWSPLALQVCILGIILFGVQGLGVALSDKKCKYIQFKYTLILQVKPDTFFLANHGGHQADHKYI
jgi:hypothetical protein